MLSRFAVVLLLAGLGLAGLPLHLAAADARPRDGQVISWGPFNDKFRCAAALGSDTKQVYLGQPLLVYLYLQVQPGTALPTPARNRRNFNIIGGGIDRTISYLPTDWQDAGTLKIKGDDYRVVRTKFAVIQHLGLGTFTALNVQAFDMTAARVLLSTGDLTLTVATPPPTAPVLVPLSQELLQGVLRERLAGAVLPDVRNSNLPLRPLGEQLDALFRAADTEHQGFNVVWVPAPAGDELLAKVTLDYHDVPALTVLEEVARQTGRTLTVDAEAVLLQRGPAPLATLELPSKLAPADYAAVLNHVQTIELADVKLADSLAAVCRTLTNDSTRLDPRHSGFHVALAADVPADAGTQLFGHLSQLSLYNAVRYLALATGCQYEVQQDRLLLVPAAAVPAAPAPAPAVPAPAK